MLMVARKWEWGSHGVTTACLNREQRESLREVLDGEWWGD